MVAPTAVGVEDLSRTWVIPDANIPLTNCKEMSEIVAHTTPQPYFVILAILLSERTNGE